MKIAIVHDYLREYGGAERVVETMHKIWPEAPLYTSFVDWPAFAKAPAGKLEVFKSMDIRTSWVQQNWIVKKLHSPLRFLAPKIWESFDLSEYDVVLSSSGWFICRGVKVKKPAVHICYIHHPPRNLYGYATGGTWQRYWPVRVYTSIINFFMRHYDYKTAQTVDFFIANSKETASRVKKFYRRDATVIYPPITMPKAVKATKRSTYVSVGRLVWSKQTEIIIKAANKLKIPLKIVGTGPEEGRLKELAGNTIEFLGSISDEELAVLYSSAKATIFAALDEDFGMVPVESMAYGTPVIALKQGGVAETVVDGKTGILFEKPSVEDLDGAIKRFEKKPIKPEACIAAAKFFSSERFVEQIKSFVQSHI